MENIIFTQLTISEVREILREEIRAVFAESTTNTTQPESDQIGGIELAQQLTGLARPTIYGLVAQLKIPYMKKGKKLYFSQKELTEWLKQGRRKTTTEIDSEANQYISRKSRI